MAANIIRFSYNWNNKLQNKAFTTIRVHNPKKYKVGEVFDIELKGEKKGTALLKEKKTLKGDQLNNFICYIDTGYSQAETLNILTRMYKIGNVQSVYFDFCLLVYTKPKKKKVENSEINFAE